MNRDINIRIAGDEDLSQIVEIYNQAVNQHGATADLTPITVESRYQWFQDHTEDSYPIWIAERNDGILGWCSLSPYRPGRMALRKTAEISYYIHTAHLRQGIGSSLIRYAIAQCPQLGFKHLITMLLEINFPSIRILEKFDFNKWGHLPDVAEFDGKVCGHLIYGLHI